MKHAPRDKWLTFERREYSNGEEMVKAKFICDVGQSISDGNAEGVR